MADEQGGPTWAVIAGGGTGGHVVPAIAIGEALAARGHRVHFVGAERGVEATMVPAAGFTVTLLPGRGIARRLTLENFGAVAGLARAVTQALKLIRRLRPSVVVIVGGYASFAGAVAAIACRVPLVVAEQNAVPGLVNRLAGRFATACAVSFDGTPLPRTVTTGNPVRPDVAALSRADAARTGAARAEARLLLGLPEDRLVVAAVGGSLGARSINRAVLDLARRWSDRSDVAVYHIVGRRDWSDVSVAEVPEGNLVYRRVEFEDRMAAVLAAAEVVVGRAGASTVAELTAAGVPSVLVPLPQAPGDHQARNAERLVSAGAAVMIRDDRLDVEALATELDGILSDAGRRERMARAARALGRPDAAQRVADVVEENARA